MPLYGRGVKLMAGRMIMKTAVVRNRYFELGLKLARAVSCLKISSWFLKGFKSEVRLEYGIRHVECMHAFN